MGGDVLGGDEDPLSPSSIMPPAGQPPAEPASPGGRSKKWGKVHLGIKVHESSWGSSWVGTSCGDQHSTDDCCTFRHGQVSSALSHKVHVANKIGEPPTGYLADVCACIQTGYAEAMRKECNEVTREAQGGIPAFTFKRYFVEHFKKVRRSIELDEREYQARVANITSLHTCTNDPPLMCRRAWRPLLEKAPPLPPIYTPSAPPRHLGRAVPSFCCRRINGT